MEAGRQVRRLLHSSRLEMLVAWTKGGGVEVASSSQTWDVF